MSTGKATASDHRPGSALDDLLTVEQEIAGLLAAAEREAGALVAAARDEATAIARVAEAALAMDLAVLEARARAEQDAATKAIEEEAARAAERYRALDESTVARLAEAIALDVAGLAGESIP